MNYDDIDFFFIQVFMEGEVIMYLLVCDICFVFGKVFVLIMFDNGCDYICLNIFGFVMFIQLGEIFDGFKV